MVEDYSMIVMKVVSKELKNISDYLNKKLKPMGFIRLPYSLREDLGADFHYGGTIPKVKVNKLANALFSDHLGRQII